MTQAGMEGVGVLQLGLTGGIGSGKSTIAAHLEKLGAVLIDSDGLAREVLAPGAPGLRAVTDRFGAQVLGDDGALDRAALAAHVFADPQARRDLERITHPRIAARTAQLVTQADAVGAEVVVHDVPLLVEKAMQADYHLVLVVHADPDVRVQRIVDSRDTAPADARARIDAQAGDDARRAVADVWVDNTGSWQHAQATVTRLWRERLQPFAANLRARRPATWPDDLPPRPPDPTWPQQAQRLIERLRRVLGPDADIQHVGPTAAGLPAQDVLNLLVSADDNLATIASTLARAGFFDDRTTGARTRGVSAASRWHGRSADPGRPAAILATGRDEATARRTVGRRVEVRGE